MIPTGLKCVCVGGGAICGWILFYIMEVNLI